MSTSSHTPPPEPGAAPEARDALSPLAVDLSDPFLVDVYDELPLWSALAGQLLLEEVPLGAGLRVLDVGCGTGFPALELAQRLGRASHVTGIDLWPAALSRARRKADLWGIDNVLFVDGDAARTDFGDASFDLLVSSLGVNNFADPRAALRECRRVARPGATLALATNVQGHMAELYAIYRVLLDDERAAALDRHVAHRATAASLRALLDESGFTATRVVDRTHRMRFASGAALLRHAFIRLGFLPAWVAILDGMTNEERARVMQRLDTELNRHAARHGELSLTIPLVYVEAFAR